MKDKELLTEEQLDFLRETINIGAGNAAANCFHRCYTVW